jgi:predicted dehydrogenase
MFDMGPYYLTDLVQLLGPIARISGAASVAIPERTITHGDGKGGHGPKWGQKIKVETPDHIAGTLEFASGCVGTIITTFATYAPNHHTYPITIFGTEGTLRVPDPNGFDGDVQLFKPGMKDYEKVPFTHTLGYGRSVGVADMAYGLRTGRKHRASGELAFHVLDAMAAFLDAGATGKAVKLKSKLDRPAMLPTGLPEGKLDE